MPLPAARCFDWFASFVRARQQARCAIAEESEEMVLARAFVKWLSVILKQLQPGLKNEETNCLESILVNLTLVLALRRRQDLGADGPCPQL